MMTGVGRPQFSAVLECAEAARESLRRATALVPDRSRLPLDDRLSLEATLAMVARDYGHALDARRQLAERHPASAAVQLDLGRVYEARDEIAPAVEHYRRATELDPESPAAFVRLGVLLGRQGRLGEALESLARAEALHTAAGRVDGVAEVLYHRAVAYDRADRLEDAGRTLQRALALAESAGSRYLRAAILLRSSAVAGAQGRYDEAAASARQALEIGKGYEGLTAFGLVDLGNVYLYAGQRDRAAATFEDALERAQRARARRAEARARLALGALQVSQGRPDAAEAHARAALVYYRQAGFDNLRRTAMTVVAAAQQTAGKLADAQTTYESLLEMAAERRAPGQIAQQHFQLANVLLARERYADALRHSAEALSIYRTLDAPYDVAHSHLQQSDLLWRLGRFDEAERELEAAAAAQPAGARDELQRYALLYRAHAALAAGAPDRAATLARRGLAQDRDDEVAPLLHRAAALGLARSGRAAAALPHIDAMRRALDDSGDAVRTGAGQLARAEVLLAAGRHAQALELAAPLASRFDEGGHCESAWIAHIIAARAAAGAGRPADADAHTELATKARRLFEERLGDTAAQVLAARRDLQAFAVP
jgi:tetratricopeptide (TPR) repeat protein